MQRIDKAHLYKKNTSFFFRSLAACDDEENSVDARTGLLFFLTFPISCPISFLVANIKTITDIMTREPLSVVEKNNLIDAIPTLNPKQFRDLVENIIKYSAKSEASCELISDLQKIDKQAIAEYGHAKRGIIAKIINDKKNEFVQNTLYFFKNELKDYKISLRDDYKLSESEVDEFDLRKSNLKTQLANAVRERQQKLIIDYLNDPKNVGKKMEHVIMDAVNKHLEVTPSSAVIKTM